MKIKSPLKLVISILAAQLAGIIGSLFTFSSISTWYVFLNKPSFSPPNWVFGPVWTILYIMIGISFYLIWTNHKKDDSWIVKFMALHLLLNSLWSIIFFGAHNLGLAFFEIVILWLTIIFMIIKFQKINKLASYLLIPYLLWVSFASILNISLWKLNPNSMTKNVFAQYLTAEDKYRSSLSVFQLKKGSYLKNQTLSLKDEVRVSLLDLLKTRNDYKLWYLNLLKLKFNNPKLESETRYLEERKIIYKNDTTLENLIAISQEEDTKYKSETINVVYFTLSNINLNNITRLKNLNINLYNDLKNEAQKLIDQGKVDSSLFNRWFTDINNELTNISNLENETRSEIDKINSDNSYLTNSSYNNSIQKVTEAKLSLLKLNKFIKELDNTIQSKK